MVADEDYVSLAEEQLFGPGRFRIPSGLLFSGKSE